LERNVCISAQRLFKIKEEVWENRKGYSYRGWCKSVEKSHDSWGGEIVYKIFARKGPAATTLRINKPVRQSTPQGFIKNEHSSEAKWPKTWLRGVESRGIGSKGNSTLGKENRATTKEKRVNVRHQITLYPTLDKIGAVEAATLFNRQIPFWNAATKKETRTP